MSFSSNKFGISSVIIGLLGLVMFKFFIFLCIPLCIAGLFLGIFARKESSTLLSILGITFSLIGLAASIALIAIFGLSIHYIDSMNRF